MKKLRKILFYFIGTLLVLIISITASVFLFKDRIIREFINEANKSLNTPIKIGKIDISAWNDFPNLAIVFTDVYIEDSHPGNYPLLTAQSVSFSLNPIEAWRGKYAIRGLQIIGSETNLKINRAGINNFNIVKESTDSTSGNISFNLANVKLTNTRFDYNDLEARQHYIAESEELTASIDLENDLYRINADGDITTGQIGIKDIVLLKGKKFEVDANIDYDDLKKEVVFKDTKLKTGDSEFAIKGNYLFKDEDIIDLHAEGSNTDIQTILSLFPESLSNKLHKYQSKGNVFFNLGLKGEISRSKSPFISISFGCSDATFFHPDYQSTLDSANLVGSFASPSVNDWSRAELFLKKITGKLNGKEFQADFSLQNFEDPYVTLEFKGTLEASSVMNFYPIEEVKELSGDIQADISFNGLISLLKKKATAQQVKAEGSITLNHVNMTGVKQNAHFRDLNGTLQFNNNDLALSNVGGYFENSDFLLNGFLKNVITFLIFEDQPIGIEADLKSNFLDVDQLVKLGMGAAGSADFGFKISPNLHLNFNCEVKSMKYKRFHPLNIKGDLLVKNQMAVSRKINLKVLGGDLTLNGIVDAKNPKAIDVVSAFKLKDIYLDSIFYLFENFHQDLIMDTHLKGQVVADISLEMTLNEKLKLFPETLVADISAVVTHGELNEFAPMKDLNKYLDDESLSKLRFGVLKNDVHIENKTIYIPLMEISSNATTILLSGTHTFDQHIDYRVIAPLFNRKKIDPDEAFGAIEEDLKGHTKIFLKVIGTADNFKVTYDKQAVKKKIVNDFKKEVQELKDAFRLKGKKKQKELELEKEEFFDWDN